MDKKLIDDLKKKLENIQIDKDCIERIVKDFMRENKELGADRKIIIKVHIDEIDDVVVDISLISAPTPYYCVKVKESNGKWGDWIGPQPTEEKAEAHWRKYFDNEKYKDKEFALWVIRSVRKNPIKILEFTE